MQGNPEVVQVMTSFHASPVAHTMQLAQAFTLVSNGCASETQVLLTAHMSVANRQPSKETGLAFCKKCRNKYLRRHLMPWMAALLSWLPQCGVFTSSTSVYAKSLSL